MRKLTLFIAAQLITLCAAAQLGTLAGVAHSAVNHALSPKISRLPFDTTTWHYAGHSVFIQRYEQKDLSTLYGSDEHQQKIAFALSSLQDELNRMKGCLSSGECNYVAGNNNFRTLESEKRYFDYTNYLQEYQAYIDIQKQQVEMQKQAEEARRAEAEHNRQEQEQIKNTVLAEDENTMTDFDIQHQSDIYVQAKTKRLAELEKRRVNDSLAVLDQQMAAQREKQDKKAAAQYLTKKYGAATAKKLLAGDLWIGETTAMVRDEYGEPDAHISKTTAKEVTEAWSYTESAIKLTFKNHKLATIIQ